MEIIKVKIINWQKHQPVRKDVVHSSWFKVSNRLMDDPKILAMTPLTFSVFMYMLCQCSQNNSDTLTLLTHNLHRTLPQVGTKRVISAIFTLESLQVLSILSRDVHVTSSIEKRREEKSARHAHRDQSEFFEDQKPPDLGTNKTKQPQPNDSKTALHRLAVLWNENCGSLPKVKEMNSSRDKLCRDAFRKNKDPEHWKQLIQTLKSSSFHSGKNNSGWRANFDYFLRPNIQTQLLEGAIGSARQSSKPIDFELSGEENAF